MEEEKVIEKEKLKNNEQISEIIQDRFDSIKYLLSELKAETALEYVEWLLLKTEMRLNPQLENDFKLFKSGIYYAYLGKNVGAEIEKERPCIIVWGYPDSETVIVVPCSKDEKYIGSTFWYHIPVSTGGTALVEQIRTISKTRITRPFWRRGRILTVGNEEQIKIDFAIEKFKFIQKKNS
ncbi:MAG: type II toxin-antitoxin system PemK/MazF family toxin [Desulfitobacteriaceae bacterium]